MSGEIIREWNFWLASILTGACMAFSYDVIRLFRRLVRHGRLAVDLEDIVYWSACFGVSFMLLYYGNNGVIRFAAVLGAALGMAVYMATLGRFFIRVSYFVIDRTAGSLLRFLRRLLRPVKAAAVKLHQKKIIFYQKCRLTGAAFRHKIVIYFRHRKLIRKKIKAGKRRNRTGKGETGHGRDRKQKPGNKKTGRQEKKNTGIPAHKK